MRAEPGIALVTGGVRSGKSVFAERLARRLGGAAVSYVATAEALDDEMRARIAAHRARRHPAWETLEAPRDAAGAVRRARHRVVLLDCLTLLVSNALLADGEEGARAEVEAVVRAARESGRRLVVVTNEVGWSVVPANALARRFRDLQGWANRRVSREADAAWLLVAGRALPLPPPEPEEP